MHCLGLGTIEPRKYQNEASFLPLKTHRGAISMPTGTGKSLTIMLLINTIQVRTLVVVPNLGLKRQFQADVDKYFGKTNNIVVENIDSASLAKHTNFDCLIIDEGHHSAASTYRKLNKTAWKGIYYRYFFSATPFRSRDEEQLLYESLAGQVIYRLTYQDAVKQGAIVPLEAYYYEVPKTEVEGNTWSQIYSEIVVKNKGRNALISGIIKALHKAKVPTLTLVKEIAHGEALSALTDAGFANGQSEDCQYLIDGFNAGKLLSLIGTTGVLGEGIDSRPAQVVIVAGLGKSKNQFMQMAGRGFRLYPGKDSCKIIIFKDNSHKWTKTHFAAQVKFLKEEYGITPIRLT